jgi:3-oxoadipate enol-lactonase
MQKMPQLGDMTEHFLESRGIAYRANEIRPERPTLLLVHGLSSSSSAWLPYEKLFENDVNVIIPDLRGNGLSKRWPRVRDYSLEEHADDLAALLDELQIKTCIAVGYSIGALIVLAFGRQHPHKLSKIMYISPTYQLHRLWRLRLTRPFIWLGVAFASLFPVAPRHPYRVDYTKYKNAGDESFARVYEDIRSTGFRAYMYALVQWYAFHYDRWWKDIDVPTLIIHGTHDTIVPREFMPSLQKQIPHAKLVEYEHGNHMLVYHNIAEVGAAIKDFIQ